MDQNRPSHPMVRWANKGLAAQRVWHPKTATCPVPASRPQSQACQALVRNRSSTRFTNMTEQKNLWALSWAFYFKNCYDSRYLGSKCFSVFTVSTLMISSYEASTESPDISELQSSHTSCQSLWHQQAAAPRSLRRIFCDLVTHCPSCWWTCGNKQKKNQKNPCDALSIVPLLHIDETAGSGEMGTKNPHRSVTT